MTPYGDYPDLASVRRALVIKLRNHGDVLLSSPLFAALKAAMPHARIDAYVFRDTAPMLEGHPAISGFHLYDREWKKLGLLARVSRELGLLRDIRRTRYDMVINLTDADRGAIAAWLSGARYRAGWVAPKNMGGFRTRFYTHIVKGPPRPRHAVELALDAARRIGIFPRPGEAPLHLHLPEAARQRVVSLLAAGGIEPGDYLLVHPTSRWLFKSWPIEKYSQLFDRLADNGIQLVVSAAPDPSELEVVKAILAGCQRARPFDLAGQLSLKELGALIEASSGLLCVDSVPLHIASALKKPTVALFGPSSEQEWGPWDNPRAEVLTQPYSCRPCGLDGCGGSKVSDCLTTLPVERVLASISKVIYDR